jgi:hypothetical protein
MSSYPDLENTKSAADPKLSVTIGSPKIIASVCGEMPSPGSYLLIIICSGPDSGRILSSISLLVSSSLRNSGSGSATLPDPARILIP